MEIQPINNQSYQKPLVPRTDQEPKQTEKKPDENRTQGRNIDKLV